MRLLISHAAIDSYFRQKGADNQDGKADANLRERIASLQERGEIASEVDINRLYAAVLHVSFSVNFFGVMVSSRPNQEIDALFRNYAKALANSLPVQA